jgi:hypothetical protein
MQVRARPKRWAVAAPAAVLPAEPVDGAAASRCAFTDARPPRRPSSAMSGPVRCAEHQPSAPTTGARHGWPECSCPGSCACRARRPRNLSCFPSPHRSQLRPQRRQESTGLRNRGTCRFAGDCASHAPATLSSSSTLARTHANISLTNGKGRAWPEWRSEAGEKVRKCGRGG